MNYVLTDSDILMSETMQKVCALAKASHGDFKEASDRRTALISLAWDVIRAVDDGGITCTSSVNRGVLFGLLVCVFETHFNGTFSDHIENYTGMVQ